MGLLWPLIQFTTGTTFLILVVLSIPLAFDVGGQDCGLTFSLLLATFYFVHSTFRIIVSSSRNWLARWTLRFGSFLQYLIVPTLLIYSLHQFSPDGDDAKGFLGKLVQVKRHERTWEQKMTIGPWETFLTFSTPIFQLCEGFCSLLVIQACGQVGRWLVNKNRSDGWMIALLIMSGSVISGAAYFLYRITQFSSIGNMDTALIAVTVTCCIFLCSYGIVSGRGNPVESSLLFAYIVLSLYQIFTDYQPNNPPPAGAPLSKPEVPPFPPVIMDSYRTVVASMTSAVPITVGRGFRFIAAVIATITPSVLISLAYRLFVFYSATRIIPAVREQGARGLEQSPSLDDEETSSWLVGLFTQYSPSILVAIYTHLLMQHFALMDFSTTSVGGWVFQTPVGGQIWRWINIAATMLLYYGELLLGEENPEGLTSHWKTD